MYGKRYKNYVGYCSGCEVYLKEEDRVRASQIHDGAREKNHMYRKVQYKTDPWVHVVCNQLIRVGRRNKNSAENNLA